MLRTALITILVLISAAAVAPSAGARGRTTYIVRDGFWGGLEKFGGSGYELAYFELRHRRVQRLNYLIYMQCHNVDSNEDYTRGFTGGHEFPGGAIASNGELSVDFVDHSANYEGRIHATFSWRGRSPSVDFVINTFHTATLREDCSGSAFIRLHHGKRPLHPIPSLGAFG